MGFLERMGEVMGYPPEPSPEAKKRTAKESQLSDLIARRNAIMVNQAPGLKANSGESHVDSTELASMDSNIKLLQKELEESGK